MKKLIKLMFLAIPTIVSAQTHCDSNEQVVFSCSTGKKVISLCSSNEASITRGYMQYRFGAIGSAELKYPASLENPKGKFTVENELMPLNDDGSRNEETDLNFKIGSFRYLLIYEANNNTSNYKNSKDTRETVGANLSVFKDDKQIANLKCINSTILKMKKSIIRDFGLLD